MTNATVALSFGEFFKSARAQNSQVSEQEVFRDFCCDHDLTMQEVSMLVNERPQLGRLKFLGVSEVVLQQVSENEKRGRPQVYGEYYAILKSLLKTVKEAEFKYSFREIYDLAIIHAMKINPDVKVPHYSTAYSLATKHGWR